MTIDIHTHAPTYTNYNRQL